MTIRGRLDGLVPDRLSHPQRELYDLITGGARASGPQAFALTDSDGALNGPFNAMLLSPGVGVGLQGLGTAIRYDSELSPRIREMAILMVATHGDSAFERHAHEAVGALVGLTETEILDLRAGRTPTAIAEHESAAIEVVAALLARSDLDDQEWDAARSAIGEAAVFEITSLVGYYLTLALQLRVFRVPAPTDKALDTSWSPADTRDSQDEN